MLSVVSTGTARRRKIRRLAGRNYRKPVLVWTVSCCNDALSVAANYFHRNNSISMFADSVDLVTPKDAQSLTRLADRHSHMCYGASPGPAISLSGGIPTLTPRPSCTSNNIIRCHPYTQNIQFPNHLSSVTSKHSRHRNPLPQLFRAHTIPL